jgi:hypothetical protein
MNLFVIYQRRNGAVRHVIDGAESDTVKMMPTRNRKSCPKGIEKRMV